MTHQSLFRRIAELDETPYLLERRLARVCALATLVGAAWGAAVWWFCRWQGGSLGMVTATVVTALLSGAVALVILKIRADSWSVLATERAVFKQLEKSVHGLEALFTLDGRLTRITPSIQRLTGFTQAECLAATDVMERLIYEPDRAFCRQALRHIAETGESQHFEVRFVDAQGKPFWMACHWQRIIEPGLLEGLHLSAENIQSRKETEFKLLESVAELRRSRSLSEHYLIRSLEERNRLTALLNSIRLGILFMDRDQRVLYYNRIMQEMWGCEPDVNLIGTRAEVLRARLSEALANSSADALLNGYALLSVPEDPAEAEQSVEWHLRDGRILTERSAVIEGSVAGEHIGRVWVYEDITEQRRTAAQLIQLAEHDPLTNLYNRRRFHEELNRMFADAERRGYQIGLLIFDLDGFKPINDAFGHQAGDEVLVVLAREVGAIIRRNEVFCRLGGDEFGVLVPDAQDEQLLELARRIVEKVADLRFNFAEESPKVTASLGIAIYPQHALNEDGLIAAADHAMYVSKSNGRNRWTVATTGEQADDAAAAMNNP